MAEKGKQGTGKHPHKSTKEPYPHHDAQQEKSKESGKAGQKK